MLENLFTDEEKTGGKRNVLLLKDTKNYIELASELRGNFKENGNKRKLILRIRYS